MRSLVIVCGLAGVAHAGSISGTVIGTTTKELIAGATVVAEGPRGVDSQVAISDENGRYKIDLPPGTYTITIYYLESTREIAKGIVIGGDVEFGPTLVNDDYQVTGCVFWHDPSPDLTSHPRFGYDATRSAHPMFRDRTHRTWIAGGALADPRIAVTTIDGGQRLNGPGIPIAFLEDVMTYTSRVPVEYASGTGGSADVTLRNGSNELAGDARLIAGIDDRKGTGGIETFAGGPLARDKAWLAAGLVAVRGPDDTLASDGMLNAALAPSPDHMISLAGLAHAAGDSDRAGWATAKWVGKFYDYKLEVRTAVTAEAIVQPVDVAARGTTVDPQVVDRVGGQTLAKLRAKAAGYHAIVALAGVGNGTRDGVEHADASVAIGDDWQIKPNVNLIVGVRNEQRQFGDARTSLVTPRAAMVWDPTKEGRSDLFVAYQRISRLDDGLPGDWRGQPLSTDEASAGLGYLGPTWPVMIGIAARVRAATQDDREAGIDAWLRYDNHRTSIHAQATTLGRIATVVAQRRLVDRSRNKLGVGLAGRTTPDRRDAGATVTWHHEGERPEGAHDSGLGFDLGLEAYASPTGPGGRLVLGIAW